MVRACRLHAPWRRSLILTVLVVVAFRDTTGPGVVIGSNAKGNFIHPRPLLVPRRKKVLTATQDAHGTTTSVDVAGTPMREGTPTLLLKEALDKILCRNLCKSDMVFTVHNDTSSNKFRAKVELHCFPQPLTALGDMAPSEKEAKHSAANKMLSDPVLQVLSAASPSDELRNMLNRQLHRPPRKEDLVYLTTEDTGRFVTRVDLTCFDTNVSIVGEPSPNKKEAKKSAMAAMLINSKVQKLLGIVQPRILQPTLVLHNLLAKTLKTSSAPDITYSESKNASAPNESRVISSVELPCLEAGLVYTGCAPTKWEARRAAAQAALSDPVLQARLSDDSISALQDLVNQKFRRPLTGEAVLYTIAKHENATNSNMYVANAQLNCVDGRPARDGLPRPSKVAAKHSAAEALLSDPQVQQMLRS